MYFMRSAVFNKISINIRVGRENQLLKEKTEVHYDICLLPEMHYLPEG